MNAPPQRLKGLHINRMIPNVLTLLALTAGLSALRFALLERWEHAALAILAASVLDGLDGRIARILKGATKFGAELDSLSDFVCFGVAPAMVLYLWALADAGRFGWAVVLVVCICCALRLARFNTDGDEPNQPAWNRNFFVGVPSPAGAGLVMFPMILWFQVENDFLREPVVVGLFMLVGAGLLVSRIRTYSFKKIRVAPGWVLPSMLGVGLYLALLLSLPWVTLAASLVAYAASIPFSARTYRAFVRKDRESAPAPSADAAADAAAEPPGKGSPSP